MASWRAVRELPRRSGASDAEVALTLPGDDLVPAAGDVVDRCTTLAAPPDRVWPWLAQLGKGRAGWYFPRAAERLLPPGGRGLRRIEPALLGLAIGDEHDDWGPGRPTMRVRSLDPPRSIVYLSLRDRSNGERWPMDDRQDRDDVLAFSWALVLRDAGAGATRLHLRLRMKLRTTRPPVATMGGLFDWVTVALLFRGLRERVVS
jgi:hypothetical protein